MELNAVTRSVGDIFTVNKKYLVPRFQREYSWTTEEVDEFWDDIVQQITLKKTKVVYEEYFIGCIVLIGEDSKPDYLIVDGQQRLTTLTILLRAIVETLRALGDDTSAKALYKNVIEGTDNDGNQYFKLQNQTPRPFFQNEIQAYEKENLKTASTDEEKLLQATYSSLLKRLKGWAILGKTELDSVKALRLQVLSYLKFILVTAKNEDDAYTIFETLNARGLSLSSVDLIKNWIFKNYKNTHPNDNAKSMWSDLGKKIGTFSNLETFFRHYWNSKYAYASNDRLYNSFNEFRKKGKITSAKDFLLELEKAAERYRKIVNPLLSDWKTQKEKAVVAHLENITQYKVTQVRPFLLALFECRENKLIDETTFITIIKNLDNFHLIFSNICQDRASGLEGTYTRAAKALYQADTVKTKIKDVIKKLNDTLIAKTPNLTRIKTSLDDFSFSKGNETQKKTIQIIFAKIEVDLQKTSELKVGNISLEHIEDQATNKPWISSIGNLIPLDEKLNNQIKPGSTFGQKKIIYKKSEFKLVKLFLKNHPTDIWNNTLVQAWKSEIGNCLEKATLLVKIK